MTLKEIAAALIEHCKNDTEAQALSTLYAEDCVSVEASALDPEKSPVTEGLENIRGKHAWWAENFEVHSSSVDGPYLHGADRFAVIIEIDATHKASQQRNMFKEVAVFHVANQKITREEFFYTTDG